MNSTPTKSRPVSELQAVVPTNNVIKFLVAAEFDNKKGRIVKNQLPKKIPGFKDNSHLLAELMIPAHIEHSTGLSEDFTIFILYKDLQSGKFLLIPKSNDRSETVLPIGHAINTIFEDEQEVEDEEVLFFLSAVKAVKAEDNERGAKIQSVAIGTSLKQFICFKPVLVYTLQNYMNDGNISHLIELFNALNKMDLSTIDKFSNMSQNLFKLLQLDDYFRLINQDEKFTTNSATDLIKLFPVTENDKILKSIPINFKIIHKDEFLIDQLNSNKLLQFLETVANHQISDSFTMIIYSNKSTDFLSQFILKLSKLSNRFKNQAYNLNNNFLYIPFTDLYNFEELIHEKDCKYKIIGTNNIILKDSKDVDFFYDLDENIMSCNDGNRTKVEPNTELIQLYRNLHNQDFTTIITSLKVYLIEEILTSTDSSNDEETELNLIDYFINKKNSFVIFEELFEFHSITVIELINALQETKDQNELIKIYSKILSLFKIKNNSNDYYFIYLIEILIGLNDFFKPIFLKNPTLQKTLIEIYDLFNQIKFINIIISKKLNSMIRKGLDKAKTYHFISLT